MMIMASYMIMMMMIVSYMDDNNRHHDVTGHVVHCSAGPHKRLRDSRRILSAQHSWPLLSLYSSPGREEGVFCQDRDCCMWYSRDKEHAGIYCRRLD